MKGSKNDTGDKYRRRGGKEPRRVPGVPNAPPYLSALEQAAWTRFAKILGEQGMKVASQEEFAAYEALVVAYVKFQRLAQALRDLPDNEIIGTKTIYNKQGDVVGEEKRIHPLFAALNGVEATLANWLGKFGLTPGDAGRVAEAGTIGDGAANDTPMAEF